MGERVASVVGEFSLDDEDSALSRLVGRVEQAQGQISAQFSLDNPESGLTRIVQRLDRFERAQNDRAREFETRVNSTLLERHRPRGATRRAARRCTATTSSSASASSCRRSALRPATCSTPWATPRA